ncbi:hypothetical protein [Paenibacillus agaridevorans]|uniref:hypothetical protein n=1 Tax=Paenibacillus agaridevorans TaxID=171404 RepID=UPI0011B22EF0|nr:hypothetical protein [Paenibacillus agaridevorans]
MFEWDEAHPAQAWVNGEYVLVGVQLQERADEDNFVEQGSVGNWIVAKGGEQAALLHDSERSFSPQLGPKDLLRMAIVVEPSFFMTTFKVSDADRWISYVFNPARSEWSTVERGQLDQLEPDDMNKESEAVVCCTLTKHSSLTKGARCSLIRTASIVLFIRALRWTDLCVIRI